MQLKIQSELLSWKIDQHQSKSQIQQRCRIKPFPHVTDISYIKDHVLSFVSQHIRDAIMLNLTARDVRIKACSIPW